MRILILLLALAGTILSAREKPNIIFILADDLGVADPGLMGSRHLYWRLTEGPLT
ncbi:MAG: hypothetical protein P1U89_11315 [Verrucomicrobiales bacterium]|nr:hypothetical protein [Verrucomicrobiales bacterium]